MSALIKAGDVGLRSARVAPFAEAAAALAAPPVAAEPVISVELVSLRRQLEGAGRRLEQDGAEIERLRAEVTRAFHDGDDEGYRRGLKHADARRAEQLALFEAGLTRARAEVLDQLNALEGLAAQVAREALGRVLGDDSGRREMLVAVIRRQFAELEAQSILAVSVSRADFADEAELQGLADALGRPVLSLGISDELKPGDCRIQLSLGALEVGLDQQRRRLDQVLLELSGQEAAR